jgi:hypothetical protein
MIHIVTDPDHEAKVVYNRNSLGGPYIPEKDFSNAKDILCAVIISKCLSYYLHEKMQRDMSSTPTVQYPIDYFAKEDTFIFLEYISKKIISKKIIQPGFFTQINRKNEKNREEEIFDTFIRDVVRDPTLENVCKNFETYYTEIAVHLYKAYKNFEKLKRWFPHMKGGAGPNCESLKNFIDTFDEKEKPLLIKLIDLYYNDREGLKKEIENVKGMQLEDEKLSENQKTLINLKLDDGEIQSLNFNWILRIIDFTDIIGDEKWDNFRAMLTDYRMSPKREVSRQDPIESSINEFKRF